MRLASGQYVVATLRLLQNQVRSTHVILGVTPVASGVYIAQLKVLGLTSGNQRYLSRNLASNKGGA